MKLLIAGSYPVALTHHSEELRRKELTYILQPYQMLGFPRETEVLVCFIPRDRTATERWKIVDEARKHYDNVRFCSHA